MSLDNAGQLLLVSNSTLHGSGYLDHVEQEIREILNIGSRIVFLPYALHDRQAYTTNTRKRFRYMGFSLFSLHDVSNMARAIEEADAIFVGGGNTFRLLRELHDHALLNRVYSQRHSTTILPFAI